MKSVHICVFGASITWGAYDAEKGGWVERLKIHFFNQEDENFASVYNLAVSGATAEYLLKRFDVECEARRPDIIVFSIGNNDSQFLKSEDRNLTPIEKFQKNIEKLYEKSLKFAEKIVFIGLTGVDEEKTKPVYWNEDSWYTNEEITKYDSAIEKFCQEKNLKYVSLKGVLKPGDWEDGLHPNAKGHEKIFEKIKPEVLSIFQEIKD
ncbi:MAG: GDSL-type esterase/lipase family protein [Candidatus Moranbacteria bacterium]|nr:GDSL-type esterase/lipase family protein [Candidatus Moranbacteria bacterium]